MPLRESILCKCGVSSEAPHYDARSCRVNARCGAVDLAIRLRD